MNVVGRVGSLITQGVYSVATPFHPFGGAVDIIVVQQQNGSYRSTPWYVRFGKFQGVLKGAEKIVKIEVNGSEANFHMNLDNSGEAYFTKEEPYDKENEKSEGQDNSDGLEGLNEGSDNDFVSEVDSRKDSDRGRHRYSVSGEDELEMRDERVTLGMDRLERTDSDAAIFYDFQDVQFSLDTSAEPSDYNSSQSDNLDDRVHVLESHGNSEVILVSIDGHILTAPIKSAEKNGENLNLNTPEFHLGPGKVTDLKNDSTEFSPGEDVGTTESFGAQNISPNGFTSQDSVDEHKECVNIIRENKSARITGGEVATSCLELTELANHIENVNHLKKDSSADSSKHHENMKEGCLSSPRAICEHGNAQLLSGSDTYSSVTTPALSVADADADADAIFEKTPLDAHNDIPDNIPNQLDNLDSKPEEHNQLLAEGDSAESKELLVNDSTLEENEMLENGETDSGMPLTPSGRRWKLWSMPFRRQSNEEVFVDSESVSLASTPEQSPTKSFRESPPRQYVRTNVPTSDQIESLNLREGQNIVTFIFSTRVLGLQKVDAHIYLWKHNARIVISDVDGTITKSDVLGQFMPLVGKDWTHSGIAHLFSAIKENGYQLLFLSARAIVQAYLTKTFLFNLKQDGKSLPSGPVVISPDGLFPSLYREVIRRAPHEFKIACLEDIKALFPPDHNPFYAGFGNRNTDELSYRKIGIPMGKIFIINPKGEVAINNRVDVKSYTSLHTLVHDMFPPTSSTAQEDYNSWNYWKMPLMDLGDL